MFDPLAAELRSHILCCGQKKKIYALDYYIISLLPKIRRIEGNFLNPRENLSETNEIAVMRLPEVYAEIDEGFVCDILWRYKIYI